MKKIILIMAVLVSVLGCENKPKESLTVGENKLKVTIEGFQEDEIIDLKTRRKYMLTENFYIDYARKNIVKFDEIDNIKLKFSFSLVSIIDCYGLNQFISITTKDNKKINILNWSFSHWYPEDGEIYDIFVNKIKKG